MCADRKLPNRGVLEGLRNNGKTLQEIADLYGASRERVRQVIGNTGRDFLKNRTIEMMKGVDFSDWTVKDIPSQGLRSIWRRELYKHHHSVVGGMAKIGNDAEKRARALLENNDIACELMPLGSPFDILCNNGLRIDVKTTTKPFTNYPGLVSPKWRFKVGAGKRGQTDFYMCITSNEDIFIIPSIVVPQHWEQLQFCWPALSPSKGRFSQYKDAYRLLRKDRL